jgi:hypothetical protein
MGAPKVPHGMSLLTRHHAQAPAVLNHSRALPQGDGGAGPAFTRRAIGGERNLIVLDAGDVFDDAFAVRCPPIDAEGEVSSGFHRHFFLRHSSSYRCAVLAARSRAAATTNLACLSLALVLRAIFGGKSCALVNVFMTCPRWSAGGQPTTKLCPRSRRSRDKERPHLPTEDGGAL